MHSKYKQHCIFISFIFLIVVHATIGVAATNNSLEGYVTDTAGNPLYGVIVNIPDLKVGTSSDTNGHYVLKNLPQGRFLVQATLISYATSAVTVTVRGSAIQNFTLSESAIESHEVVVTGQSKATELKRNPVPIVTLNAQALQQTSSTNIIDAITQVPGVSAVTTGPNVSKPFIRGLGYNRVLTLYDGMRQEGQQWGDEHGIEVDQFGVDRVEVIKGPASLIYGSDALAGVVNLIPTPPPPDGKIVGNVVGEYQTNNGMVGGSAMLSGNKNGFYWLGRASEKAVKNYQDPIDGRVYGTNYQETDASATLGLNKKWGYSHLDLSMFNDLQAIPDGSRDSATRRFTKQITEVDTFRPIVPASELNSYNIPILHQHIQHYRAFLTNSFDLGNGRLAVNVGFERSIRQEFSHPQAPDVSGLDLQLNSYIYDVKYFLPEWKGWNTTVGVNGMYQTNDATKGTEFIVPSYHEFDIGPFALLTKTIGKLDISGGVRYDSRTYNNDALYTMPNPVTGFDMPVTGADTAGAAMPFSKYDHTFSGITGSIGATYLFSPRVSMKANVSRGFRSPNIAEISANGVHPGTFSYQLGNPDFKPEFSLQEDVGIDYASRHFTFSVAVFNNNLSNYIFNQKLLNKQGQDSLIVAGVPTFQYQQGRAELYGGEFSLDVHPHPLDWLHFENTLTLTYGINEGVPGQPVNDSSKYLPYIPPVHGTSELRVSFRRVKKYVRNAFVKAQVAYFATQNRVYLAYNTETPTPGYTLFNAALGADIVNKKGRTLCNISVFGNNLFDVAYQDHLSRLKYFEPYPTDPRGHLGIYNMGRNVDIKLSVPLDLR
jgi:iron complex outermembrane recepter protein